MEKNVEKTITEQLKYMAKIEIYHNSVAQLFYCIDKAITDDCQGNDYIEEMLQDSVFRATVQCVREHRELMTEGISYRRGLQEGCKRYGFGSGFGRLGGF